FTVSANGAAPLTYRWYKDVTTLLADDSQIGGSSTSNLRITNVNVGNAGDYTVVVSNSVGPNATSSPPATLVVTNPVPIFLSQPQNQTNLPGTAARFTASIYAAPPISYFWSRYGTNLTDSGDISGSGTRILTVSNVSAADATDYILIVTNQAGANTSSPPASLVLVNSGFLALWDFNAAGINPASPAPSAGSAG